MGLEYEGPERKLVPQYCLLGCGVSVGVTGRQFGGWAGKEAANVQM